MIFTGGCHCGQVRFEVEAPKDFEAVYCNCSICSKVGYLHLLVEKEQFRLLSGENMLSTYTFNSGVAKHTFCKNCGVKSFYTPRSNPNGVSVNVRCLDTIPENLAIKNFDGKHWEESIHTLHK